jgi:hypothetical protein
MPCTLLQSHTAEAFKSLHTEWSTMQRQLQTNVVGLSTLFGVHQWNTKEDRSPLIFPKDALQWAQTGSRDQVPVQCYSRCPLCMLLWTNQ